MSNSTRILILEDNPFDSDLIRKELTRSGLKYTSILADDEKSFIESLDTFNPDIILSDYNLPTFNGLEALRIANSKHQHIPFIFITGIIGEELAIETVKNGAYDFILKSNLKKLPPAVYRAMQTSDARKAKLKAEIALEESRKYQQLMIDSLPLILFVLDPNDHFKISWITESCYPISGFKKEQFTETNEFWISRIHPDDKRDVLKTLKSIKAGKVLPINYRWQCANEQYRWFSSRITFANDSLYKKKELVSTMMDITKQKQIDVIFMKAVVEAQEEEKSRFAQELHDSLGQMLSAAKLNLSGLNEVAFNPTQLKSYNNAVSILETAMEETRGISHSLMPKALADFGLIATLEDVIEKINQTNSLVIKLSSFGEIKSLDKAIQLVFFRISQELINNTLKHANATEVNIQLTQHKDTLVYIYEDNGTGFNNLSNNASVKINNGIGLKNIEARVKSLNGILIIDSTIGKGSSFNIEIPLTH